jgi:GDPmannose 4,6-dehydratase
METKAAIVTGASGQDGSYLCELLLEKGYDLKCLVRRVGNTNPSVQLYEGDVLDQSIIHKMIRDCEDYDRVEIYNLAAQSRVHTSFTCPNYTFETNTTGILNILEGVRQSRYPSKYRIYQASSSEMFGKVKESPQNEETPFYPRSVYGVSKGCGTLARQKLPRVLRYCLRAPESSSTMNHRDEVQTLSQRRLPRVSNKS